MQQQLLRSRYPSSNLIGQPVFLLCKTEKICRTGRKKKHLHFRCANVRSLWKHPYEAVVLFQRIIASEIRLAFSRSVWKGLNCGPNCYIWALSSLDSSMDHPRLASLGSLGLSTVYLWAIRYSLALYPFSFGQLRSPSGSTLAPSCSSSTSALKIPTSISGGHRCGCVTAAQLICVPSLPRLSVCTLGSTSYGSIAVSHPPGVISRDSTMALSSSTPMWAVVLVRLWVSTIWPLIP